MKEEEHISSSFSDLILWKRITRSFAAFVAINLLLLLLSYYSFVAVACVFFLFLCFAGMFLSVFGAVFGVKSENLRRDDYEFVSSETLSALILLLYNSMNQLVVAVADIATTRARSHYMSLVWGALGLFLMTKVMSDLTIVWLAALGTFMVPAIYVKRQKRLDELLGRVRNLIESRIDTLTRRIPQFHRKKVD